MASKSTRNSFGETIARLGRKHPELVVLDADLGASTRTAKFARRFPSRHLQLGVAEHNMIGIAAGLALCGKIPVATSFACFITGRHEALRAAIAHNHANVKLVGTHAGLGAGGEGSSHMGLEDIAAIRSLPDITILSPADDIETRAAVEWMLSHTGPVYLRLTRQKVPAIHATDYTFRLGVPDVVFEPPRCKGRLLATIFASGAMVAPAITGAKDVTSRGFPVKVLNAGTIRPFDEDVILRAAETSQRIVTVEDHNRWGGLGTVVCEILASWGIACPVIRLGMNGFGESGTPSGLYKKYGLSESHIAEACIRNLRVP